MATGVDAGLAGTLFHMNLKINCQGRGYQTKLHLVGADYAAVVPNAVKVASALRLCLPQDASVFYATISRDNTKKDSKYLKGALGNGLYTGVVATPPVPTKANEGWDALLVRFENEDGGYLPMKIGPVPDAIIDGGTVVPSITDLDAPFTAADPAAADGTDYAIAFTNLMKFILKYCYHVRSGHAPGGVFTYWGLTAAYVIDTSKKKGGRSFV